MARGPHKKNLHLCMLVTFLVDFCMYVPNFCMSGKQVLCISKCALKYEYGYDENVGLSIYYSNSETQSFYLIL